MSFASRAADACEEMSAKLAESTCAIANEGIRKKKKKKKSKATRGAYRFNGGADTSSAPREARGERRCPIHVAAPVRLHPQPHRCVFITFSDPSRRMAFGHPGRGRPGLHVL